MLPLPQMIAERTRLPTAPPGSIRLLDHGGDNQQQTTEVVGVIVTINAGGSYDELFTNLKQDTGEGRVLVYEVKPGRILAHIQEILQGDTLDPRELGASNVELLRNFKANCDEVGPEAVCFNFECCQHYGDQPFDNLHKDLIAFLVKQYGCMVMCSDFSLKSLIRSWDSSVLGPNPLVQIAEFSGDLRLAFNCEVLKDCPSTQLVTVGSLCDKGDGKGSVLIQTLPSTIAYTLSKEGSELIRTDGQNEDLTRPYEIEVLTVAELLSSPNFSKSLIERVEKDEAQTLCFAGGIRGLAGHILITFPPSPARKRDAENGSGEEIPVRGRILTSCGHWIELMKIDTNVQRLLEVVRKEYGENSALYNEMAEDLMDDSKNEQTRESALQSYSHAYVQSKSPAKYKKK